MRFAQVLLLDIIFKLPICRPDWRQLISGPHNSITLMTFNNYCYFYQPRFRLSSPTIQQLLIRPSITYMPFPATPDITWRLLGGGLLAASLVGRPVALPTASAAPTTIFTIFFLRKEYSYTKLKYSRVPQYDIVSGGVAAIFAGFLGFLICEKFGFELLDSGDLYIVLMYVVFLSFFGKLCLRLFETNICIWPFYSYRWGLAFYYQGLQLGYGVMRRGIRFIMRSY